MEAAENNHLETVKYLIKAGALVDPKVEVFSLLFSPEEASVFWTGFKSWQRGNGLACLGCEGMARLWLLVVSTHLQRAASNVGQVLPLAALVGGTKCREYLISCEATKF